MRREYKSSNYQQVEYIQSSGTQWIDTGVIATEYTKMQFKFKNISVTGGVILGLCIDDSMDYRFFNHNSRIYFDYSNSRIYGSTCNPGTIYEFEFGNYYVKQVGASVNLLIGSTISNYTSPRTITINNSQNNLFSSNAVYYLKIYNGNSLVRDFAPARRKSDNKPGLYDLVTNTFFINQGTGADFTLGPDVN